MYFHKFFVEPITGAVVKLKKMFAINVVICIAVKKRFTRAEIEKSNACSYGKIQRSKNDLISVNVKKALEKVKVHLMTKHHAHEKLLLNYKTGLL